MNKEEKKRLAELNQMRKDGSLTESELKELGELQEKAKETDSGMLVTETQLKELIESSVGDATKKLEEELTEVKRASGKIKHSDEKYCSPTRGVQPVITNARKKEIGVGLRDFILGNESKALTELTDAAGGILIPTEFRDNVIFYAGLYGLARKRCQITPMISKDQQIDAIANEPIAYWVGEDEDSTESSPTFKDMKLTAKELAVLVTASKKFINDLKDSRGIDIFDLLSKLFAKAIYKKEDDQYINGNGTVFTGLLGDATIPTVVMPTGKDSFADVTYDDLIKLTRAVPIEFKSGAKPTFTLHQDIIAHIETIKDTTGQPIFKRGLEDGENDRLLGFLIDYSDLAPSNSDDAASKKFIAFGDGENCSFGDRETFEIELFKSGTVGGVNLITKRRVGIQATEQVAIAIHNPNGFATLKTAA